MVQDTTSSSGRETVSSHACADPPFDIVVPVLNEARNIAPLLEEIEAVLGDRPNFEIVIVDDGSTDGSGAVLAEALERVGNLRVLSHDRTCGKSAAILTGVAAARAPFIVTLDGDGQNDPADIPTLLAAFARADESGNLGLAAGQRRERHDPFGRRVATRIGNAVRSRILRDGVRDTGCGLKIFPRQVFLDLPYFDGMHRFLPALVQRHGLAVELVEVAHRPRQFGQSKYGVWNRLWVGLSDMLMVYWFMRRCHLPDRAVEMTATDQQTGKD